MKSRFAYSLIALALAQHSWVFATEKPIKNDIEPSSDTVQSDVIPAADASEPDAKLVTPERIAVHGRAMQMYVDKETTIGTKTAINVMELPQSVQVLTEQLIVDQAARNITDLYRSIAGVSEFSYSGVTFRGFRDDANVFMMG